MFPRSQSISAQTEGNIKKNLFNRSQSISTEIDGDHDVQSSIQSVQTLIARSAVMSLGIFASANKPKVNFFKTILFCQFQLKLSIFRVIPHLYRMSMNESLN